jgi:hypothetical protein
MSDVGTSREAVGRLAELWERSSWAGGGFTHTRAAATLRALLSERDAARAEAARLREALDYVMSAHGEQLHDAFDKARAALGEPTP